MTSNKFFSKWLYLVIALVFFIAGSAFTFSYQRLNQQISASQSDGLSVRKVTPTLILTVTPTLANQSFVDVLSTPKGKFTIVEKEKITADKAVVETGEKVNFTVTLTNQGSKKKLLTHICFNYSGGVTFGCVNNKNLYPGESFNINNSMMFAKPGIYSVWITWSQDHTNFYRPVQAGRTTVVVE